MRQPNEYNWEMRKKVPILEHVQRPQFCAQMLSQFTGQRKSSKSSAHLLQADPASSEPGGQNDCWNMKGLAGFRARNRKLFFAQHLNTFSLLLCICREERKDLCGSLHSGKKTSNLISTWTDPLFFNEQHYS